MINESVESILARKYGVPLAVAGIVFAIWTQPNISIEYKIGSILIAAFVYFMLIINEKLNIINDKIDKKNKNDTTSPTDPKSA